MLDCVFKLIDISDDGFTSLLDDDKNETRDDIKLPAGDLGAEIQAKFDDEETIKVTVLKALGEEAILSYKVESNK
jgi:translation initiation factor 5A